MRVSNSGPRSQMSGVLAEHWRTKSRFTCFDPISTSQRRQQSLPEKKDNQGRGHYLKLINAAYPSFH